MTKGAVYVATSPTNSHNRESMIRELLCSVRLLSRHSPSIAKTLVASKDIIKIKSVRKFFSHVIESKYKEFDGSMGAKIQALELSPYDLTLVLDNDTLPILDITKGFDFVGPGKRDIALSIAPRQELNNSGITNFQNGVMFVHRNEKTLNLFDRWMNVVRKEELRGPTRFIFSRLLYESDVAIYPLSFFWNFRIDLLLDYEITLRVLDKILPKVRVLHSHLKRKKARLIFKRHPSHKKIKINAGLQ